MTSFTWQAFTWHNCCMTHDFMKSISMKCICMIKVTNTWRNKTMIHINTQPNNIYMTTHKHEYHPHETKEQLYDVQLHDVANTWFVSTVGGAMRTLLIILCYFHVWPRIFSSSWEEVAKDPIYWYEGIHCPFFFYWPDTKAKYLALGWPLRPAALYNGTHQLQSRHSSKFIMALNVGCIIIFFSSSGLALWRVPAGDVVAGQLPGRGSFREDGPLVTQLCRGWDLRYAACLVTRG